MRSSDGGVLLHCQFCRMTLIKFIVSARNFVLWGKNLYKSEEVE